MTSYTHTGRLARTGYYAVTSEAVRKPGKRHAVNRSPNSADVYLALCGETIAVRSDDHFMDSGNYIEPAGKYPVTCKRCLKKVGATR